MADTEINGLTAIAALALGDLVHVNDISNLNLSRKATYQQLVDLLNASGLLAPGSLATNSVITVKILDANVTLAKQANLAQDTIIGRVTASTGVPEALSATNVRTIINVESGADVTDTANVTSAGALMDSEVDADLKTFALPASTTISAFGATLVDDAAATNARTTLGLVIGTDVQAFASVLANTTASFTTTEETKLSGIESLADVTDETNVNAAGAVMETDYGANTILVATTDDTPVTLTVAASRFVGRKATGNIAAMTAAESRAILEQPESFIIACSDESTTELSTATSVVTFRMPYAFTLTDVRASVQTAPTGSVLTVDINETGSTILSTKITIDVSEKTSETAATAPVISDTALADDAEITIDIDTVGSTIAGKGLKVYLIGHQA